jgi:hypothetical protein
MHQVDPTKYSEWNSLVASKPKGCIIEATQQFIVGALLLAQEMARSSWEISRSEEVGLGVGPRVGTFI